MFGYFEANDKNTTTFYTAVLSFYIQRSRIEKEHANLGSIWTSHEESCIGTHTFFFLVQYIGLDINIH